MAAKVVDASALVAVMFNEPESDEVRARLTGAALVAPSLLDFEIINACATRLRRYPELRSEILEALALRNAVAIEIADVDHAGVLALAEQTGLTGYDASYLWLARRLGAELVTLDGPLSRAAGARI